MESSCLAACWNAADTCDAALRTAVCALVSLMSLLGWMVPTISRLVQPNHGGLDSVTVATQLRQWTMANWVRIGIDFLTFLAATRALTISRRVLPGPLAMSETRLSVGDQEM